MRAWEGERVRMGEGVRGWGEEVIGVRGVG